MSPSKQISFLIGSLRKTWNVAIVDRFHEKVKQKQTNPEAGLGQGRKSTLFSAPMLSKTPEKKVALDHGQPLATFYMI